MEEFKPKKTVRERYTFTEEDMKKVKAIEEHKEKLIKSFMDIGMTKEEATLQTLRKMYICD